MSATETISTDLAPEASSSTTIEVSANALQKLLILGFKQASPDITDPKIVLSVNSRTDYRFPLQAELVLGKNGPSTKYNHHQVVEFIKAGCQTLGHTATNISFDTSFFRPLVFLPNKLLKGFIETNEKPEAFMRALATLEGPTG
jgi:hypothetical protein